MKIDIFTAKHQYFVMHHGLDILQITDFYLWIHIQRSHDVVQSVRSRDIGKENVQ